MAETPEARPPVWTGHIFLPTADITRSARFYEQIGMRSVAVMENSAALEMRGGTHLAIRHDPEQSVPGPVGWDLMVEDIDATHDTWQA
jgi:catechol 2,3-dioxygenase-like lactoylglutathione lyase family enzyme